LLYTRRLLIPRTKPESGTEVCDELLDAKGMELPSFVEGLLVMFMESLALGRLVISTYIAGIAELVKPNEAGWLVPACSQASLQTRSASF
jgi:colanic acid/amylovoran biosynthesis glycosyltransferase